VGTRCGTKWGPIGNILGVYIENLRNILRACWGTQWKHSEKTSGTPKIQKEREAPSGKNWASWVHAASPHWPSRISTPECVCQCFCPRLMARAWSCVSGAFVWPCPCRDRDYHNRSNFWKFYLIRTSFILGEPVSLVKLFTLFRLERTFLVFRVWTQYIDVQHLIEWQG
jgi:hypothetical protein